MHGVHAHLVVDGDRVAAAARHKPHHRPHEPRDALGGRRVRELEERLGEGVPGDPCTHKRGEGGGEEEEPLSTFALLTKLGRAKATWMPRHTLEPNKAGP